VIKVLITKPAGYLI